MRRGLLAVAMVCCLGWPSSLSAQESLQRLRPQFERPPLPEFRGDQPQPELTPPPTEPPRERLSSGLRVFIREIRLEGNTVFSDAELSAVIGPYVARTLTTEDLVRLRDALTRYYVERGYITSGAIIPDQDVVDGVITVRIVEGTLAEVNIGGLRWLRQSYVADRIVPKPDAPLNVDGLRERLQLLNIDPAIERLDARLEPGAELGRSRLDVNVTEPPLVRLSLAVGNQLSPSVGGFGGEVDVGLRNVLGYSDPLDTTVTIAEGLQQVTASYSVPLTVDDLRVFVNGQYANVDVTEEPFDELQISGVTWQVEGGFRYPLLRATAHELAAQLSLQKTWSQTKLLGEPFSFSEGVENGESRITAIRFVQEGFISGLDQVFAARSTFTFGIGALDATENNEAPDGRFVSWLGQAQYAYRLDDEGQQLIWRGDLQLTDRALLPIQQYALGGYYSVRGYRDNLATFDNGWSTSLEWRYPLTHVRLPYVSEQPDDGLLVAAPFVDLGGGWNRNRPTPEDNFLCGIGAGLRWTPAPKWLATIYYGKSLIDAKYENNDDLQDYGIYFELRVNIF